MQKSILPQLHLRVHIWDLAVTYNTNQYLKAAGFPCPPGLFQGLYLLLVICNFISESLTVHIGKELLKNLSFSLFSKSVTGEHSGFGQISLFG